MDQTLRDVLLTHYNRYPQMKIEDYVKLIYQQTFGPAHFSKKVDYVHILSYLIKELQDCVLTFHSPIVESIGNQYYRVSLQAICKSELTVHELTDMFIKSMEKEPEVTDFMKQAFLKKLDILLEMIKKHEIPLDYQETTTWIQVYVKKGIMPTHHSEHYQQAYHPMYRIIHHDFLPSNLHKKIR